jgi:hypothetical protein
MTRRLTRYRYDRIAHSTKSIEAMAILAIVYDILDCNISPHNGMI